MIRLENLTFDELKVGERVKFARTLREDDVERLADASAGLDPDAGAIGLPTTNDFQAIATGAAWAETMVGAAIATRFPGPGSRIVRHKFEVTRTALPGDAFEMTLSVKSKTEEGRRVVIEAVALDAHGDLAARGEVEVIGPQEKLTIGTLDGRPVEPREKGRRYRRLMEMARRLPPLRTAVVHPVDEASLLGALESKREGLIDPIFVGPEARIRAAAEAHGLDISGLEIIATEHSHGAAATAVAMAREGKVEALMKGALHTDELMGAVVDGATGLRTARRITHVFAIDAPSYPRALFITDAAINIYPTLMDKRDIIQNAIDLARALGILVPRVAILSAVETVSPDIRSTIDAAALCKMADRGQITGGVLDGPLAFDNAASIEAARTKGIASPVAGRADILVPPDLEAGNMLAKQLVYLADADMAGIVMGARVPIMLTSRADGTLARLGSSAIALLWARRPK
jgi:phosphate acetyltransferase/phosphate butyryltransferase